ncbi:MAG: heme ABC exporter ATP-binding protein CcmA [Rhodospirillaceae bacterium]|nr:heme ABC exporter ATP-binding protein CcmA [Rhodospirillaceae bacterium]
MTRAPPDRFAPATLSGHDLACRRGGRLVFARLSFTLNGGEALVLRGANGSGKSTLLRLLAGLSRAQTGRIEWNGRDIGDDPERHGARVRLAAHLDAVKPSLSVRENLLFWARLVGAGEDSVAPAVEAFALTPLMDVPARVLSAGQRHRVALARVLLGHAPLWLLDEPANTLDDAALKLLAAAVAAHRARGGMVVIASHGEALAADGAVLSMNDYAPPAHNWDGAAA